MGGPVGQLDSLTLKDQACGSNQVVSVTVDGGNSDSHWIEPLEAMKKGGRSLIGQSTSLSKPLRLARVLFVPPTCSDHGELKSKFP